MEYIVPKFLHAHNLNGILAFCKRVVTSDDNRIVCNASQLKFVDPAGLCLLAAACARLAGSGKNLELIGVPEGMTGYLARMDLFKACGIQFDERFLRHDRTHELVEISLVNSRAGIDRMARRIAIALAGQTPDYDPNAKPDEMSGYLPHEHISAPLQYIFSELLENALTHGRAGGYRSTGAWLAAQYYPTKDVIRLAVVDDGCGFLGSLKSHAQLTNKTHEAAIHLALLPRVTCNPDYYAGRDDTANQGVGLTVIKDVVLNSEGIMRITSGDCCLRVTRAAKSATGAIYWQGVILALELQRQRLRELKINQVIQGLMDREQKVKLRFE